MRCAIFPGLAHKRLIRALQTYLHCKGLPLNTSQGLIYALFKSCAPITNWLESSASSITQKRPLQIKIHMIYTWKALKGISSLLMSHKCFKHPNFYSWCEKKKMRACQNAACVCVSGWREVQSMKCSLYRLRNTHLSQWESVSMRQTRSMKQPFSQTRQVYRRRILVHKKVKWR